MFNIFFLYKNIKFTSLVTECYHRLSNQTFRLLTNDIVITGFLDIFQYGTLAFFFDTAAKLSVFSFKKKKII